MENLRESTLVLLGPIKVRNKIYYTSFESVLRSTVTLLSTLTSEHDYTCNSLTMKEICIQTGFLKIYSLEVLFT